MSSLKDKKSFKIESTVALTPAGVATGPAEPGIGRIADIGSDGAPIVDFPEKPDKHKPLSAILILI